MLHTNISVNEKGHLALAGVDTVDMAEKYGTPLYLVDESRIREKMRTYIGAMKKYMPEGSMPLFASKALCMKKIYKIANEEGMGIDLVSPGELYTAKAAGFPLQRAFFHGNNKTDADIKLAIESGLGYFVADNREELDSINRLAGAAKIKQKILLRLTPGIDPHTHAAITTGKVDSKFGTAIETGQAFELVKYILTLENIELEGFHCHIGSQCFEIKPFCDAADIMIMFMAKVKQELGKLTTTLNLGGGFGVRYTENDPEIDITESIMLISKHIDTTCSRFEFKKPRVLMEPGRSIVADAGVTLYTVGSVKNITGYKSYVSIDGGMTDNPRYALYQSEYTVINASRADEKPDLVATVGGRCCESGDLIQENVKIKTPVRGEKLAVLVTGAYNYAMASNYNRLPRPAMVMLKDGIDTLAVRRESFEDLVRNDID